MTVEAENMAPRNKVLIVIQCADLGGMERATLRSVELLKKHGVEVSILSLNPFNGLEVLCRNKDIPISMLPHYHGMSGLADIAALVRHIRRERPTRVWCVGHNLGSVIAGKLSGVPTFLSLHYHHNVTPMWKWRIIYAVSCFCCRKLHFVSHFIFDQVKHWFKEPEKTMVFCNSLPESPPLPRSARKRWGLPEDAVVIGNAGRLQYRKAFDVFLHTAAIVAERIPNARFLIAGDGPERAALEELARRLNIADKVVFAGWLRDMAGFWSSIDLLLFNTRFDCLPEVPLEAVMHSIPVVASIESCGLYELLNEHGGFMFRGHDPLVLADAVCTVVRMSADEKRRLTAEHKKHLLMRGSSEPHWDCLKRFLEI
jgi:glycosyltransferase involved in cell wall biosynthesis